MRYRVRTLVESGVISVIELEAGGEAEARRLASARGGTTVLSVQAVVGVDLRRYFSRTAVFPLVLFSQELLALLAAGLNLVEAMDTLAEKEDRGDTRQILERLNVYIHEGQTFSMALTHFPAIFPALYVATVRSAERTGDIGEALGRYVNYRQRMDGVREKIVSASIYPAILAGVGGLVTLFLMVYVVPRFSAVFESTGRDLPVMSRLLVQWGHFLAEHPSLVALLLVGALAFAVAILSRVKVRAYLLSWLWRIPALGARYRIFQLGRYYRTLGMLLRGGIPVVTAMQMAQGLLPGKLAGGALHASGSIQEGVAVSSAMHAQGLTTPVALKMLRVGEQSGRLGEMMESAAAFHDDEIERSVDRLVRLFEPLLMAAIGIVVGGIVVLMYFPIFELASSLQ